MTDEELAREKYEKEALNWPSPIGWDNLGKSTQKMWIMRVQSRRKRNFDEKDNTS